MYCVFERKCRKRKNFFTKHYIYKRKRREKKFTAEIEII